MTSDPTEDLGAIAAAPPESWVEKVMTPAVVEFHFEDECHHGCIDKLDTYREYDSNRAYPYRLRLWLKGDDLSIPILLLDSLKSVEEAKEAATFIMERRLQKLVEEA